jgi:hypothetical protein
MDQPAPPPRPDFDRLRAEIEAALAAWDIWEADRDLPRHQRRLAAPPPVARATLLELVRTLPRPPPRRLRE